MADPSRPSGLEPEPEREPEPKDTSRPEMPQQTGLRERKPLSPEALAELKAEEAAILAELAALEADEADADTAKTAKTALLAKRLHIVSSVHRPLAPTHACPVLGEAYSCDSCSKQEIVLLCAQIDAFLVCIAATAVVQLVYCLLAGFFPLNSLLAGVACCVATFVLTMSLRMQVTRRSARVQRMYAEYLFANIVVHFAVLSFMG